MVKPRLYKRRYEVLRNTTAVFVLVVLMLLGLAYLLSISLLDGESRPHTETEPVISTTATGQSVAPGRFVLPQYDMDLYHQDWRAYVFDQYFASIDSPMQGTGDLFVKYCELQQAPADCMAIIAIAGAETNYCKYGVSAEQFNCWGFGGGPGNRYIFSDFDDAIGLIYDRLANQYPRQFLVDPSISQRYYCGTGPECEYWSRNVISHMYRISNFSKELGFPSLKK